MPQTQDKSAGSDRWREDEQRWAGWMRAAHGGDSEAYERLLQELGRVIEQYIRVRFGAIDGLEDCVQECLITVHRARHTYDVKRPFRPWLFTLVRHQTIDVLRRGVKEREQRDLNSEAEPSIDANQLHRRLDGVRVLENLDPDHREAVALTQYAGFTAAEAANWLGISESALKGRLRRGLLAIRKHLEAEGLPT